MAASQDAESSQPKVVAKCMVALDTASNEELVRYIINRHSGQNKNLISALWRFGLLKTAKMHQTTFNELVEEGVDHEVDLNGKLVNLIKADIIKLNAEAQQAQGLVGFGFNCINGRNVQIPFLVDSKGAPYFAKVAKESEEKQDIDIVMIGKAGAGKKSLISKPPAKQSAPKLTGVKRAFELCRDVGINPADLDLTTDAGANAFAAMFNAVNQGSGGANSKKKRRKLNGAGTASVSYTTYFICLC